MLPTHIIGIGNFLGTLNWFIKENNLNLVHTHSFPDHHYFSVSDIEMLLRSSTENGEILLTTEKDYYRFPDNSIISKSKIQYLKIKLEIENKNSFIELIKNNIWKL